MKIVSKLLYFAVVTAPLYQQCRSERTEGRTKTLEVR